MQLILGAQIVLCFYSIFWPLRVRSTLWGRLMHRYAVGLDKMDVARGHCIPTPPFEVESRPRSNQNWMSDARWVHLILIYIYIFIIIHCNLLQIFHECCSRLCSIWTSQYPKWNLSDWEDSGCQQSLHNQSKFQTYPGSYGSKVSLKILFFEFISLSYIKNTPLNWNPYSKSYWTYYNKYSGMNQLSINQCLVISKCLIKSLKFRKL